MRERLRLIAAAASMPEQLGTMAQDYLAAYLMSRICAPEKMFVDVGAHIGSVVAAVQRHCPKSTIVAIEAMSDKAAALTRNFPNVKVMNFAVGDVSREVEFHVDTLRSGYSSLVADRKGLPGVQTINVPMQTLDRLLAMLQNIDVIKIDVEGAEYQVLLGSNAIIESHRPLIIFESALGSETSSGQCLTDLFDWFKSKSYSVFAPNRVAHNGSPFSRSAFAEAHIYPRIATNYFAIPDEKRIEVRDRARKILSIRF
jgi:FkbM family methyltransferase